MKVMIRIRASMRTAPFNIETPWDKHQARWTGFDDKLISLYARGMTVRGNAGPSSQCPVPVALRSE